EGHGGRDVRVVDRAAEGARCHAGDDFLGAGRRFVVAGGVAHEDAFAAGGVPGPGGIEGTGDLDGVDRAADVELGIDVVHSRGPALVDERRGERVDAGGDRQAEAARVLHANGLAVQGDVDDGRGAAAEAAADGELIFGVEREV